VSIEARDPAGNSATHAAADAVAVEAATEDGRVDAAEVRALGSGRFQLAYTVTKAGPYEVVLLAPATGERWSLQGACVAAAAVAASCVVTGAAQTVAAGSPAVLTVSPFDSFGNVCGGGGGAAAAAAALAVRALCDGPGEVVAASWQRADGATDVSLTATVAGSYTVSLTEAATGAVLGDPAASALTLTVTPAPVSVLG
jgi:hypothetical protein